MRRAPLSAVICLLATLPLFGHPLALCTLVRCQMLVAAPVVEAESGCCQHRNAATVIPNETPCHSQDRSTPQPQQCFLTATERNLARPAASPTAPELAPLRIASASAPSEFAPQLASTTQPSPTLLLKRQFDPVVAHGPRAPPVPGGKITPSDWV